MVRRPCLVAVHAHPDDESSKGAATIVRYASQGVRCVLISCTGGEAGEVIDPEVNGIDLAAMRAAELREAAQILGYESTHVLGYRDSGMRGDEPDSFANIDLRLVVADLVDIFRRERPDVVVSYDARYAARHPDHQRSYEATCAAFDALALEDWPPSKLYGCRTHSPKRLRAMHEWLTASGRASPYADALRAAEAWAEETTTRVDTGEQLVIARRALSAHRSQVAEDDPWFFSVPIDAMRAIYPYEDYVLMRSRVPIQVEPDGYEHDLFAGLGSRLVREMLGAPNI